MISFELSLLVLLIAVIILLILYVLYALEPQAIPSAEEKMSAGENIPAEKPATTASQKAREKKHASTQPQTDLLNCPYGFGYLKKRDKKATIPEECLACPRALECLGSSECRPPHCRSCSQARALRPARLQSKMAQTIFFACFF